MNIIKSYVCVLSCKSCLNNDNMETCMVTSSHHPLSACSSEWWVICYIYQPMSRPLCHFNIILKLSHRVMRIDILLFSIIIILIIVNIMHRLNPLRYDWERNQDASKLINKATKVQLYGRDNLHIHVHCGESFKMFTKSKIKVYNVERIEYGRCQQGK